MNRAQTKLQKLKLRQRVSDICCGLGLDPMEGIDAEEYIQCLYDSFSKAFDCKIEQVETIDTLTETLWRRGIRP